MKPMTEKMTNPANILVALFVHVTIIVSLQGKRGMREQRLNKQISALVASTVQQYPIFYLIQDITVVCTHR